MSVKKIFFGLSYLALLLTNVHSLGQEFSYLCLCSATASAFLLAAHIRREKASRPRITTRKPKKYYPYKWMNKN